MATCPECAGKMGQMAVVCPQCGYDFPLSPKNTEYEFSGAVHSYGGTALLVALLTAVLFLKLDAFAFPLLGLTAGLATRSRRRCLTGLLASTVLALFLLCFAPTSNPAPMSAGLFYKRTVHEYGALLLGALLGAALQVPLSHLANVAFGAAIFCFINFAICISFLRQILPGPPAVFDYSTLAAAVPVFSLGIWWPVDFVDRNSWKQLAVTFKARN
jgi:hypothetical protein